MGDVVYTSEVRIERVKGALRNADLPEGERATYGVHGAIAEHYKAPEGSYEPHATTLDHFVGATAG